MLNPDLGVLLITHYQRLLNYITPDVVHVLAQGRIVKSGGKDLALRLEDEGYGPILREAGLAPDVPDEALLVPAGPGRRRRSNPWRPPASRAIDPMTMTHLSRTPSSAAASGGARPGRRSGATSRSSTRRSTATRSSTSTRRRRARSRAWSSTPSTTYYREYNANVHRGIYTIGEQATAAYEEARARVGRFINAPDSHEIVFTRNATEAINLVAYSWGRRNIDRGDAIVLTEMEHHANLVPWQLLVQERDGDLEFIPITDDGILRLDVFEVLLRLKPKLVAFTHVSNTLGTINPVARDDRDGPRGRRARARRRRPGRARTCRSTSRRSAADFYAFSGHKMLGPDGLRRAVGPARAARGDAAVPVRRRDDPRGPPPPVATSTRSPGSSRRARRPSATRSGSAWPRSTWRRSAWTRSASTSASWSTYALEVAPARGPGRSSCTARWIPALRGGVIPFNLPGIHPHDVAQVLDRFGIAVRAGHHCTMPLHERLDLAATARASFNVYTTRDDIDALAAGLQRGPARLQRLTPRGPGSRAARLDRAARRARLRSRTGCRAPRRLRARCRPPSPSRAPGSRRRRRSRAIRGR